MPIAIEKDGEILRLIEEPFRDEDELQACLERCPYLLVTESEPRVVTVQREVALPAAGFLDILLVNAEGEPVAVEVKLARNAESRREVIAQTFDYVSDLTQLTVDELDDAVDGALIMALEKLREHSRGVDLRKQCGTNLRAGRIKVVIAVDEASDGLIRIVRYINDHSDLDVRLVAISKFDGGRLLVPKVLVSGGNDAPPKPRRGSSAGSSDMAFDAVVEAYDRVADEPLKTRGQGSRWRNRWRQIRPEDWPDAVHFEFVNDSAEIGVEFHIESKKARFLAEKLAPFHGKQLLPDVALHWNPRSLGRLLAKFGKDETPERAAEAMKALIAMILPVVHTELQDHGLCGGSISTVQAGTMSLGADSLD